MAPEPSRSPIEKRPVRPLLNRRSPVGSLQGCDSCDVYQDLADIQQYAGRTFGPPPDEVTAAEAEQLAWLAQAVRSSGYDADISSVRLTCGPEALATFRRSGSDIELRETLVANFFGREVPVAERTTRLPLMIVHSATRLEDALWEVDLVPMSCTTVRIHCALEPLDERRTRDAA